MAIYPAVLDLVEDVHPALARAGVCLAKEWIADPIVITESEILRVVDDVGVERRHCLADSICTTPLLESLGIRVDDVRSVVHVRTDGGTIVLGGDVAYRWEEPGAQHQGYVLLDMSGLDLEPDGRLAQGHAEGG